jgi:HEAT repeat protein
MKRIYALISLLFLLVNISALQSQENRTVAAIVADVLAQMPANNQVDYNKQLADILSTGEEGVLALVKMLYAPGQGDNSKVEYALSGISHYPAGKGDESLRLTTSNAYVKALNIVDGREKKAFIISQLQIIGKDESVDALSRYLNEEGLSDPAARALASIGTEKAVQALRSALLRRDVTPNALRDIIFALGETHISDTENLLKDVIAIRDEDYQKAIFYALSHVGGKSSLNELSSGAEKVNLDWDKTGANEAYIALLKRLVEQGDTQEASKAASELLKKAAKECKAHTRNAALQILLSVEKVKGLKRVQAALKDASREYRNAALDYTSDFASREVYVELLKTMMKAKPEAKADILNWIGRESQIPEKNALIRTLNIRFDLPAGQVILDQLKSSDSSVKQAAVWASVKIGDASFIPSLASLLTHTDVSDVSLGCDALIAFRGDVVPDVARIIPGAPDAGKIAAVEILAIRKAHTRINTVLDLIKTGSPDVKKAAYTALKNVATDKDLTLLCGMLETAGATAVSPLQQAVIASVTSLPAKEQASVISRRMLQAGEDARYLYYVVLSATGDKDALATIVAGFRQGNGVPREAAFEALLAWKGTESADELYAICEDSSASAYFDRALTAYVRSVSANAALTGESRYLSLRKAMEIARTGEQKNSILRQIGRTGCLQALLYAGRFLDDKPVQQAAANAIMNIALNNTSYTGVEVRELLNKVSAVLDNPDADYQRENIRKHLEELSKEELKLNRTEPFTLSDEEKKEGYKVLFDGTNMSEWTGNTIDYTLQDGVIALIPGKGSGGNLYSKGEYANFVLRFDFQLAPAANNGLGIRTPKEGDAAYAGMELQILDNEHPDYKNLNVYQYHGSVYGILPAKRGFLKPAGEWNTQEVIADGDRIKVTLNGEVILDGNIREATKNGTPDKREHSGLFNKKGHIGFLGHGSAVKFRDIRIKELK